MSRPKMDIASFFNGRIPKIKTIRNLTLEHAKAIMACLEAGHLGTHIDEYLGKSKGTVRRWVRSDQFQYIIFKEQVDLIQKIEKSEDLNQKLKLLELVEDINLTPDKANTYFKPLIHQRIKDPKWLQALLDRGADINLECEIPWQPIDYEDPYIISKPIWGVKDPVMLEMFCKNGANLDGVSPTLGYSIIEQFVHEYIQSTIDSKNGQRGFTALSYQCLSSIRILVEHGASIQPLFDSLYKTTTINSTGTVADVIMRLGFSIELEKTLVYRALNFQMTREELINCFYIETPSEGFDRLKILRWYPTHDEMQQKVLDSYFVGSETTKDCLASVKGVIARNTEYSVLLKTTLEDILPLSHDVIHLICTYVYTYTPY